MPSIASIFQVLFSLLAVFFVTQLYYELDTQISLQIGFANDGSSSRYYPLPFNGKGTD